MKITIVTAAWKRAKRFELCLKNWTTLTPKPEIVVQISPGDPVSEQLAKEYGCHVSISDNAPLGKKWNDAMEFALNTVGEGYFIIQGSDDLISQKMWDYLQTFTGDYLALRDYFVYSVQHRQYLHWQGFTDAKRINEPIGSGKMIRHDFLKINPRPFVETLNRALDYGPHKAFLAAGAKPTIIRQSDTGGIAIGLKDERDDSNLNKFKRWNNSVYVHFRHIQQQHPDIFEMIQSYK